MSHIHVPDGVLPLWLIAAGWLLALAGLAVSIRTAPTEDLRRRIPLVGAVAALMLVSMSSEILPLAYHINLTVVAGILLGPSLSVVTALVVVSLLALVGHGGVTVIGLNTVVIGTEMVVGAALFGLALRTMGRSRSALAAGLATVVTLMLTTTMIVGIVALGGPAAATRESGAFDPQELRFENPFAEGVFGSDLLGPDEHAEGTEGVEERDDEGGEPLAIGRFAAVIYTLGSIGWVLEAFVTAAIIGFIARVRPGLIMGAAGKPAAPVISGDEGTER